MTPLRLSVRERTGSGEKRDAAPEAVRVWMLGGFRVSVGSRGIGADGWRLKKARSLVKLLALSPGHRLHREVLMDRLWPDLGQQTAANNLRQALHAARRAFEGSPATPNRYLSLRDGEVALCPDGPLWVDVDAFERAASTARNNREPAAYRAAIELNTGELLPEDRYEEWADVRREELRATYLALLSELAGLYERREEYERGIETLRQLVSEEPIRQEAHAGLMRLYALRGRRWEAIGQYEHLRQALRRELGTEPDATSERLREEIASGSLPSAQRPVEKRPVEASSDRHNLPAARDSFVGRERELIEVKRLLSMTGLLTLTGAGGCGKTRLALEAARELAWSYPDGVRLVELAPLLEGELLPQAVAAALGVRKQPGNPLLDTLVEHLRDKRTLLILDNCEHLTEEVARLVDALLSSCPGLRILATSREALDVASGFSWPVRPLSVPDILPEAENLERYEAVRLFIERARLKVPGFTLTPGNTGAVAKLCRKLDGVPLAIELAATRMDILTARQVAERLDRALALLTGGRAMEPRHRTLRATLDWGYELLGEPERRLFGRLSVFAGGWTLEAAEKVGENGGTDVLESFLALVDKSLIVAEQDGTEAFRYGMLEPVRQYARERLEGSGEARWVRERHAGFYLALAERAEPELTGPDQGAWLDLLEREHDNLRAARRWLRESGREDDALGLAAALWRFWYTRGYLEEGQGWLEEALAGGGVSSISRSKALNGAGAMALQRGDLKRATACFEQSLAVSRILDDTPGMARALNNLAIVANNRGDYEEAREMREQCLALDRKLGDKRGIAFSLGGLGDIASFQDEPGEAARYYEQSLALHRELGDKRSVGLTLSNLGVVARHARDLKRAERLHAQALSIAREIDDDWLTFSILLEIGCLLMDRGRCEQAICILGIADRGRREIGADLETYKVEEHISVLKSARATLDEETFEAAWSQGEMMSLEEALDRAFSKQSMRREGPPGRTGLTRREREVADLVARGMGNRRVAAELFVSERTVETHVRNALKKLGLRSRAQLAVWAADRG